MIKNSKKFAVMVCLRCVYVICCFIGEFGNHQTFQNLTEILSKNYYTGSIQGIGTIVLFSFTSLR